MRLIAKFSAALLVGICGIQVVQAFVDHERAVRFFERDMKLDHLVLGDAVSTMLRHAWAEQGRAAALEVPRAIDRGGRHLALATMSVDDADPEWRRVSPSAQAQLRAGQAVVERDAVAQHSYFPITGQGDAGVVLEVREPLADEQAFARGSFLHTGVVTTAVAVLCAALALVLSWLWVDRPIRVLCAGARRIGQGQFDAEVRLPGRDELALLAGEIDAMRRSLQQAMEQLRHADRLATTGRLAAGVAHELGTPLNVVWASARMIRDGEITGAEVPETATVIAAQAERMTAIIRQLLDFARPKPVVKAPTDLAALAASTLQFLDNLAGKRGVALRLLPPAGAAVAAVDSGQLQQVLTNLVVNAIHATPAGGHVEIAIDRVHRPRPGSQAPVLAWQRLEVRDTGCGITAENRRRLFEPFFTTKDVGEGTGLGLSVSLGIVREHGGCLEVDSTPGAGSCFAVLLPLAEV